MNITPRTARDRCHRCFIVSLRAVKYVNEAIRAILQINGGLIRLNASKHQIPSPRVVVASEKTFSVERILLVSYLRILNAVSFFHRLRVEGFEIHSQSSSTKPHSG
jgi:hypothetical protein